MVHDFTMSHCYAADNIVPLYTYCEEPPCLLFQYMENGSLYDKLQDTTHPLTWKQRANIAVGIARGLYYLHANNVVHSAIKSRNILLDKHLEPKIADVGTNRVLYNMTGKTDTQFDSEWIKSNLESDSEKVVEKKWAFHDEGSQGNGKIIQPVFSKDQIKEIEERCMKDANNEEGKKNSSDSSFKTTEKSINAPPFAGTRYYVPNWWVAHQQGKIVWKQMDVYSFGIVLLEIMSGKVPGYQSRDSNHKTLRDFVNDGIINHSEPPTEYIVPVDDEKRSFKIYIETEVDGRVENVLQNVDWAKLLFDIGRQCTIYDQTPWKAPFKDPMPWKTMQENNITMEHIFPTLEKCYNYYRMQVVEDLNEEETELDELGRRTPILEESDFFANQNQSHQMSS